jgi:hypothetical protein
MITANKAIALPGYVLFITLVMLLAGCTTVLVSPYDEKLVTDTEAFYKKAAEMIEWGRDKSPRTDAERSDIVNPSAHSSHYSKFESKYNSLIIDSEALILRAMASDSKIGAAGQGLQAKMNALIEASLPSNCQELAADFSQTSLTARNYVDLKCIILKWKQQHADAELTRNTQILKRANWEGRKLMIFNAVLAIQKAEGFKQQTATLAETK